MAKFAALHTTGFDFGFSESGKVIRSRDVNITYLKKLCDYVRKFTITSFRIRSFLNVKRGLTAYLELDLLCRHAEEERKAPRLSDASNSATLLRETPRSKFPARRRDAMFTRFNAY